MILRYCFARALLNVVLTVIILVVTVILLGKSPADDEMMLAD